MHTEILISLAGLSHPRRSSDVRVPSTVLFSRFSLVPCFFFLPFFLFCPLKITATPHRTEVNYSCAAGSRYLKYLGSRAAATAAATAAARHRHHRCASCGPLPQTRPTPRAPIGEGEEPMCARRLHQSILSSSLASSCLSVSLSLLSASPLPFVSSL